jgi:transposase InsO family protein
MRDLGITGAVRGKKVITTISDASAQRAPDLVDRDFVAPAPNRCWVADFTHVATFAEHLDRAGIAASIGTVGDAYDNSLMESTIGLFKTGLIKPRRHWKTLSEVELATAEWVDWYCHRRLHGEIGRTPPVEYETNYYRETTKHQVTVKI